MIDITSAGPTGLGTSDTDVTRAGNILSVQIGSLEYAQDLGIDLRYFLSESFSFQNSTFKAYLVEVLANRGINVASAVDTLQNLYAQYTFEVKSQAASDSLIAR